MSIPNDQTAADNHASWATVHLYLACWVDALLADPDLEFCMEGEELRGAIYAGRLLASSVESLVPVHRAIMKAEKRLLRKLSELDQADRPEAPAYPIEVLSKIVPSAQ